MYQYAELVNVLRTPANKYIPPFAEIDLTNACNQDCFYCNSAEFRKASLTHRSVSEYITLIARLADWRAHSTNSSGSLNAISFPGGGEPTLLPGYEHVIEYSIDRGFLTSLTTNGSKLHKLLSNIDKQKLQKLAWIGVDVDAGTPDLYEHIRRGISSKTLFYSVVENITEAVKAGINVDLKILLNEFNTSEQALHDIFHLAKTTAVRMIYFRPVIIDNHAFNMLPYTEMLNELSSKYQMPIKVNLSKSDARAYTQCHMMFQFPVFAANGEIYLCCENRGNPDFQLGSWINNDFRDLWFGARHLDIYQKINTATCQPCRGNIHNNKIQLIMDYPELLETLNF